jgi:FKBP-type peptidyl-prolyl cis-trans isomerase 2
MTTASAGSEVSIHYTGTLDDGSEFDSSAGGEPLSFTMGAREIIPGLERGIEGMQIGEKKSITVKAEDAYGPHHAERVQTVPRSAIPDEIRLAVGMRLQAQQEDGQAVQLTVAELTETDVRLDANHPLAGRDLTFAIEVVAIK